MDSTTVDVPIPWMLEVNFQIMLSKMWTYFVNLLHDIDNLHIFHNIKYVFAMLNAM